MKHATRSTQLAALFLFAVFAMFNLSAKPFLVDGKLVFDNFDNWTWNEQRGGFTNPDQVGLNGGEIYSSKLQKKYGKASMFSISKAQTQINKAHKKWQTSKHNLKSVQKQLEAKVKVQKTYKGKRKTIIMTRCQQLINSNIARAARSKEKLKRLLKNQHKSERGKYKFDEENIYNNCLKRINYYKDYKKIYKKKISTAKSELHTAYLNMAAIKTKAISAQNKAQ